MLVMVHRLDTRQLQLTVLNFSSQPIAGSVKSQHLAPGAAVIDMVSEQVIAEVDHDQTFAVSLGPHQGLSLVTDPAAVQDGQNSAEPTTTAAPTTAQAPTMTEALTTATGAPTTT
jgi:hypothetical protein